MERADKKSVKILYFYHDRSTELLIKKHNSEILDLLMNVGTSDLDLSHYDEATDCDKNMT
jgi:hypothetical protein